MTNYRIGPHRITLDHIRLHQDLTPKQREARRKLVRETDRKTAEWGTEPDYCQRKNSEKERDGPSSKLEKNEDLLMEENLQNITRPCTKELKHMYMNANSLFGKIQELRELASDRHYDIIGITETWCHSGIADAEISIDGYSL